VPPVDNPFEAPRATDAPAPPPSFEYEVLADPFQRLGAALLDGLVYLVAWGPLFGAAFMSDDKGSPLAVGLVGLGFLAFLAVFIYQAYLVSTTGQSLGKRWSNVAIVRVDGQPLGFVDGVLLRSIVPTLLNNIPLVGGIFALADILCIFREDRRCLHDHLASTKVVVRIRDR
jgi:uncharacterized RDD family membrane protein YckC